MTKKLQSRPPGVDSSLRLLVSLSVCSGRDAGDPGAAESSRRLGSDHVAGVTHQNPAGPHPEPRLRQTG